MKNIDEFIIQTQGIISEVTSDYFSIRIVYTLKLKPIFTFFCLNLFSFFWHKILKLTQLVQSESFLINKSFDTAISWTKISLTVCVCVV